MASAAADNDVEYELIGSYTRYSSWTARVATLLEYYQIPYKGTIVKLSDIKPLTESGLVPVLIPKSLPNSPQINDSLAICEFLAESHPDLPLWPRDRYLRALARSATAEMHSGFTVIRSTYHTNVVAKYTGKIPMTDPALKEIERILTIWGDARKRTVKRLAELGENDGGFLFGEFGIADSFYWPVLWRFRTYNLPLTSASPEAIAWMKKMWSDERLKALVADYFKQAENNETNIEHYNDIFKGNPDVEYGYFTQDWEFTAPA